MRGEEGRQHGCGVVGEGECGGGQEGSVGHRACEDHQSLVGQGNEFRIILSEMEPQGRLRHDRGTHVHV